MAKWQLAVALSLLCCQQPQSVEITDQASELPRFLNNIKMEKGFFLCSFYCYKTRIYFMYCKHNIIVIAYSWAERIAGINYTNHLPSSLSDSLLNLNPLGSFPTNWWTCSLLSSCTAMAYSRGFTHDCRQKGTLVSPTECLHHMRV